MTIGGMGEIELGQLRLDPAEFGSQGSAVLGIRDSGKTYTATLIAEKMFDAGIPFIAFDPIGVWRYLRTPGKGKGYPIVVAGGEEADIPLTPANAPAIVEAVMQNGMSLVIDLFDIKLSKADWKRIVRDCVTLLLHKNKQHGLRHIFLEEAAEFAPQAVSGANGEVYAAIEKLARMGGNSRLGYTLINQRSQEVNKAVLELCDNLFLHRQRGLNSLTNLKKWLDVSGAAAGEIMAALPTLPQGECYAWLAGSDTPVHLKVPAKNSLHPDRRVTRGEAEKTEAKRVPVNVDSFVDTLKGQLATLDAEMKANDPRALKAEIAELKRELAKKPSLAPAAAQSWPDQREEVKQLVAELAESSAAIERLTAASTELQRRQQAALAALGGESVPIPAAPTLQRRVAPAPAPVQRQPAPFRAPRESDGEVPAGCAKPLAALAAVYPSGLTEPQWATSAGYKRSGGTWGTYKSRLRGAGLIEPRDGRWFATEAGAHAAGDVELPPAPGPDLVRWWAAKLPGTAKVAEALIEAWPHGLTREDLADRIGMSASGGSFGTYLSRLAGPGLIDRSGGLVQLSPDVMG